jgi:hypothetical protein
MDAGYYSNDNIDEMLSQDIHFVLRMPENNSIFTNIVKNDAYDLHDSRKMFLYNDRVLFVKKIPIQISGQECYAYLCLDPVKMTKDIRHIAHKKYNDDDFNEYYNSKMPYLGTFMVLSNRDISETKIIDTYYARAKIEQIFDAAKNLTGLLTLGVRTEEAIRGHLLLSFISSAVYALLYNKISNSTLCCTDILYDLQELRIDIFSDKNHIIHELCKKQREVIEALELEYPFHVRTGNLRKAQAILDRKSKGKRGRPKGSQGKPKYKQFSEKNVESAVSAMNMETKRKPGRPAGSKNKSKLVATDSAGVGAEVKRGRGRPVGSKNKQAPVATDSTGVGAEVKRGRGRSVGSKNKQATMGTDLAGACAEVKRRRGRPLGCKNKNIRI